MTIDEGLFVGQGPDVGLDLRCQVGAGGGRSPGKGIDRLRDDLAQTAAVKPEPGVGAGVPRHLEYLLDEALQPFRVLQGIFEETNTRTAVRSTAEHRFKRQAHSREGRLELVGDGREEVPVLLLQGHLSA